MEKIVGAFIDSLKRNNKQIHEDAEMLYKRKIEDLEVEIKRVKRDQENMLALVTDMRDGCGKRRNSSEFKNGDFLHSDWNNNNITIICRERKKEGLYYHVGKSNRLGLHSKKEYYWPNDLDFRLATESEKQELLDALKEKGKRWNPITFCIEDLPEYKPGDVLVTTMGSMFIFKSLKNNLASYYALLHTKTGKITTENNVCSMSTFDHIANEKEREQFFTAMEENRKRWLPERMIVRELSEFKKGDILFLNNSIFIFDREGDDREAYFIATYTIDKMYYQTTLPSAHCGNVTQARFATEKEIELLSEKLAKDNMYWNSDKLVLESYPYKRGDFLVSSTGSIFVFDRVGKNGEAHYILRYNPSFQRHPVFDGDGENHVGYVRYSRHATPDEITALQVALATDMKDGCGKRWNSSKLCVEDIPNYPAGTYVIIETPNSDKKIMAILDTPFNECNSDFMAAIAITRYTTIASKIKLEVCNGDTIRRATADEIKELAAVLARANRIWNPTKCCIELISYKFKVGDKVTLKPGISNSDLVYVVKFDKYIGKSLTIQKYTEYGNVSFKEIPYVFRQDWLEYYRNQPVIGDIVIAWPLKYEEKAIIGMLRGIDDDYMTYHVGKGFYTHAVKWDGTREQYEKILNG